MQSRQSLVCLTVCLVEVRAEFPEAIKCHEHSVHAAPEWDRCWHKLSPFFSSGFELKASVLELLC